MEQNNNNGAGVGDEIDALLREAQTINKSNEGDEIKDGAINNAPPIINESARTENETNGKGESKQDIPPDDEPETANTNGYSDNELEAIIDMYVFMVQSGCVLTFGEEPQIPSFMVVLLKVSFKQYATSHQIDISKLIDKLFFVALIGIVPVAALSSYSKKKARKKTGGNVSGEPAASTTSNYKTYAPPSENVQAKYIEFEDINANKSNTNKRAVGRPKLSESEKQRRARERKKFSK